MPTPTTRFDGIKKPSDVDDFVTEDIADNWEKVATIAAGFLSGTAAARPAAAAAIDRYFYYAHDTGALTKCVDTDGAGAYQWLQVGATAASDLSFAPAGDIAATDVQTAIEELDTEKLAATKAAVDALGVNADTVDGQHASAFALSGHSHGGALVVTSGSYTGNEQGSPRTITTGLSDCKWVWVGGPDATTNKWRILTENQGYDPGGNLESNIAVSGANFFVDGPGGNFWIMNRSGVTYKWLAVGF